MQCSKKHIFFSGACSQSRAKYKHAQNVSVLCSADDDDDDGGPEKKGSFFPSAVPILVHYFSEAIRESKLVFVIVIITRNQGRHENNIGIFIFMIIGEFIHNRNGERPTGVPQLSL